MIVPVVVSASSTVCQRPGLSTRRFVEADIGLVYLVLSLLCGVLYLSHLAPSLTNDLYWPHFNRSSYEMFLVDVVNDELNTANTAALDVVAPDVVVAMDYAGTAVAQATFGSGYGRRVMHTELNLLPHAIRDLRATATLYISAVTAQYCWVDFKKRWDIAHSKARARRCLANYSDNAASYLETTMRNVNWGAFYRSSRQSWTVAIGLALEATPEGTAWLRDRPKEAMALSIEDEVQLLQSIGLVRYDLQWRNDLSISITETIDVVNALQQRQTVTIKVSPPKLGVWTSLPMFWGFSNDLGAMAYLNKSLVRGDRNHFEAHGWLFSMFFGLGDANSAQPRVFSSQIGAFGSVDLLYVRLPPVLLQLLAAVRAFLLRDLWSIPARRRQFLAMDDFVFVPRPPKFDATTYEFHGGNVMCLANPPTSYPQSQFAFSDPCGKPMEFTIQSSKASRVFAMMASGARSSRDICSLQAGPVADCLRALDATLDLVKVIGSTPSELANMVAQAVRDLGLSMPQFYQYALDNTSTWSVLQQPVLDADDAAWSFYGWIAIYDWIQGAREVIRLDGDVATLIVMSDTSPDETVPSSDQDQGVQTAPLVIFYLVAYCTISSLAVAVVVVGYALWNRLAFQGRHLFLFNRVACFVWVGRPLLLLRGLTAVLVLSSTTTTLVREEGHTKLIASPRSIWATMIVAGESTWVTYVVTDILLIAMGTRVTQCFAPLASALAWAATVGLTVQRPVTLEASIHRQCRGVHTDRGLDCTSGAIQTGRWDRLVTLLGVQAIALVASLFVVAAGRIKSSRAKRAPLLLPRAAEVFFQNHDGGGHDQDTWELDHVACIMSGLIPFELRGRHYTFDVKLWVLIQDHTSCRPLSRGGALSMRMPRLSVAGWGAPVTIAVKSGVVSSGVWRQRVTVLAGFLYVIVSGAGSVSYIAVSKVNLANDFYWATFNMTGHHLVLAEWFHQQLPLRSKLDAVRLDDPKWTKIKRNYSDVKLPFSVPPLLGVTIQSRDLTGVEAAIAGLRSSDPCAAPWIATQYCWVDFARRWPMANSATRQHRCLSEAANGAVYLESVLRNVDWNEWMTCWGSGFEIGIGAEIKLTNEGKTWLQMTLSARGGSIMDEIKYWEGAGVDMFVVQWQNFKHLGLINMYAIETALGVQYPMTLSRTNGSYDFAGQTSFKMYWQFASDLWAVGANSTLMSGKSLVRTSANCAFANQTMLTGLVQNDTVSTPLCEAFAVLQREIGPLGSIDVKIVPCPKAVRALMAVGVETIRQSLATHPVAAALTYLSITYGQLSVVPTKFLQMTRGETWGGSLLCPEVGGSLVSRGMAQFTGRDQLCGQSRSPILYPLADVLTVAVMAAGLGPATTSTLQAVCLHERKPDSCLEAYLGVAATFVFNFVRIDDIRRVEALVDAAAALARKLNVSLVQYIRRPPGRQLELVRSSLLDPDDPTFEFWSWVYLLEWATSSREVVVFEGDTGAATILTEFMFQRFQPVHLQEMPTTFATYARSVVQYVTGVMLAIASLGGVYIVSSWGRVEGLNMFELNRVAGMVWIGRPLLLLRGATALCLLSTSTLELHEHGAVPHLATFVVPTLPWYKTVLGASETTWLVYILNDIMTVWTKQYTQHSAPVHSVLVWVIAAALTLLDPVVHRATLAPHCHADQVDFQLVCHSGVVVIGSVLRLYWLVGIICICNGLSIAYSHQVHSGSTPPKVAQSSLLLSSGAKYLFDKTNWIHHDVYYMDAASALLNGLLTIRWRRETLVIDIKLWRWFCLEAEDDVPPAIAYAVPLVD